MKDHLIVFDKSQLNFKMLQNFLNCYKEKMQLSMKDLDQGDVLSLK